MLDFLNSIEFWHWWVLAALLIGIEVFAPSTVLLWPGIAAVVVGLVLAAGADLGWETQVLLFAVLSVASLISWRLYAKSRPTLTEDPELNRRGQRYIGRTFTLKHPIDDNQGRLQVDGIIWKIQGENLEAGNRVKVVGIDSTILKVEPE